MAPGGRAWNRATSSGSAGGGAAALAQQAEAARPSATASDARRSRREATFRSPVGDVGSDELRPTRVKTRAASGGIGFPGGSARRRREGRRVPGDEVAGAGRRPAEYPLDVVGQPVVAAGGVQLGH